ncbi:unnamed protein product [Durusdinium trenchii]|uniref:Uncharacterized protein n=1 Tax=Durusdinium trenchii TaxID=1381693 RepID=A0ABP0MU79_9DINO
MTGSYNVAEDKATAGGLYEEDSALPTLLTSKGCIEAIPMPQVFGATSFSDEEDGDGCDAADAESDAGDPIPPNRKAADELLEEEEFWTKAQEALEDRGRRERLLKFMKRHRFKDVNSSSGWFFNFRFPLHAAVEDNDAEMVRILLHFKAKTKLKDASGWSARQLARKRNFNGSHEAVLQILDEYAMARRKRAAARRAAREAKHQTESVCLELEGGKEGNKVQPKKSEEGSPEGI